MGMIGQVSVDWAAVGPILGLALVLLFVIMAFLKYLLGQSHIQVEREKRQEAREERLLSTIDGNTKATTAAVQASERMEETLQELAAEIRGGGATRARRRTP